MVSPPTDQSRKYEILRIVNRGGMGEIALGRVRGTKGFEKLVVLKRLRPDAERDDHRAMFDVEAELMSRIEHPNIVQVFDQPVIGGVHYLAMVYVRGRNLDQIIRRTKQESDNVTPVFALTVLSEVLRGLAFVHRLKDDQGRALGVVHQDVTPSNIMVSFFGEVKITDFGIAYVTSRDGGFRRGVLKGKPRYVAPEVLAGRRVNNRADIYGVGVVLYELLAGRALFARPTVQETLQAVARNDLPDFRAEFPGMSDGFYRLFTRSLAKDPQDRYRTAEAMSAEINAELAKLGGALSPARVGYIVRQRFKGDPDVPEIDPSLDGVAAEESGVLPPSFRAPDLDQTLSELDKLLGPDSSSDLFDIPPEIRRELAEIEDPDPFEALTPIPELALRGPNSMELLLQASLQDPFVLPPTPSPVTASLPLGMKEPIPELDAPAIPGGIPTLDLASAARARTRSHADLRGPSVSGLSPLPPPPLVPPGKSSTPAPALDGLAGAPQEDDPREEEIAESDAFALAAGTFETTPPTPDLIGNGGRPLSGRPARRRGVSRSHLGRGEYTYTPKDRNMRDESDQSEVPRPPTAPEQVPTGEHKLTAKPHRAADAPPDGRKVPPTLDPAALHVVASPPQTVPAIAAIPASISAPGTTPAHGTQQPPPVTPAATAAAGQAAVTTAPIPVVTRENGQPAQPRSFWVGLIGGLVIGMLLMGLAMWMLLKPSS